MNNIDYRYMNNKDCNTGEDDSSMMLISPLIVELTNKGMNLVDGSRV